jgi:hypothetical protein
VRCDYDNEGRQERHYKKLVYCPLAHGCHSTILLSGRMLAAFRTGPRTNFKRVHGAATMIDGPFQRVVRHHEPS